MGFYLNESWIQYFPDNVLQNSLLDQITQILQSQLWNQMIFLYQDGRVRFDPALGDYKFRDKLDNTCFDQNNMSLWIDSANWFFILRNNKKSVNVDLEDKRIDLGSSKRISLGMIPTSFQNFNVYGYFEITNTYQNLGRIYVHIFAKNKLVKDLYLTPDVSYEFHEDKLLFLLKGKNKKYSISDILETYLTHNNFEVLSHNIKVSVNIYRDIYY